MLSNSGPCRNEPCCPIVDPCSNEPCCPTVDPCRNEPYCPTVATRCKPLRSCNERILLNKKVLAVRRAASPTVDPCSNEPCRPKLQRTMYADIWDPFDSAQEVFDGSLYQNGGCTLNLCNSWSTHLEGGVVWPGRTHTPHIQTSVQCCQGYNSVVRVTTVLSGLLLEHSPRGRGWWLWGPVEPTIVSPNVYTAHVQ